MKTVKIVAVVICDSLQEKKSIFATARGYGEFKGQWEFPGGKIEYDYPTFHLSMDCFWCEVFDGELGLLEAEDAI